MKGNEMLFVKLTKTFKVTGQETIEGLDSHTDLVMEQLLKLETETVTDSDVTTELANGIVSVSIIAEGDDFDTAVQKADACIRTAIHAAGGSTPDWTPIESKSRALMGVELS